MKSISVTLNYQEQRALQQKLSKYRVPTTNEYVKDIYKYKKYTLTLYKSGSFVIQGEQAELAYQQVFNRTYAEVDLDKQDLWDEITTKIDQTTTITIGSDEVGVGDFFGGLVVCAVLVEPHQVEQLKKLGVTDSKKLTDEFMLDVYPQLTKLVKYNIQAFTPTTYNQAFEQFQNAHVLKAILHNQALSAITQQCQLPHAIIIDQFASAELYYKYLKQAHQQAVKIDLFTVNAEQKFIAVACASIIARVAFLKQIKQLSKQAATNLPLGASNPAIKTIALRILKQTDVSFFQSLVKVHFKTYQQVLNAVKD